MDQYEHPATTSTAWHVAVNAHTSDAMPLLPWVTQGSVLDSSWYEQFL